jgi:hypothetical protein
MKDTALIAELNWFGTKSRRIELGHKFRRKELLHMPINKATTNKAKLVKQYERNCPGKFRAYVENILGYKCCEDWDYDILADEFGYSYIMYWDNELKKLVATN